VILKISNVWQLKFGCFTTIQITHQVLALRQRQPINTVAQNNHYLNFHLQLNIFMQQNKFKWGVIKLLKDKWHLVKWRFKLCSFNPLLMWYLMGTCD